VTAAAAARTPPVPAQTGVVIGIAAITMTFAAFTSALVMRKGGAPDWTHFQLPTLLFANTVVLLASSGTLEVARRRLRAGTPGGSTWLSVTLALGMLFVAGQVAAWRDLAAQGVFLATGPSGAFFYVLTAAHAAHVVGGLMALAYVRSRVRRATAPPLGAVGAVTTYWHFMGGLWLYLFFLLAVTV
jgi:cytochrome c oxidase subunit 3